MNRVLLVIVALVVVVAASSFAVAWRPAIDPVSTPAAVAFAPAEVKRGETLALIGDCNRCHTVKGNAPYAGGFPVVTPFGTIYSTNITPDAETGIGKWSLEAFNRAMREGVDREGNHLYPAFPYDYFHKTSDEDLRAIYAFLMTREPVRADARKNELPIWIAFRPVLAAWKLLFLDEGPYQADSTKDEQWNRGRYLADGLGHCGACHTPRNSFGAAEKDREFAGGEAEGWRAFALDENSPAPVKWTAESLFTYLRQGWHQDHGVAAGPMEPVAVNLGIVPEGDVRAIAAYVASAGSLAGGESQASGDVTSSTETATPASSDPEMPGAVIYAGACGGCHDNGRPLPYGGLKLSLSTSVHAADPRNFLHKVLNGMSPTQGDRGGIMPAFAGALTDAQLADLSNYVRSTYGGADPWKNVEDKARRIRRGEEGM